MQEPTKEELQKNMVEIQGNLAFLAKQMVHMIRVVKEARVVVEVLEYDEKYKDFPALWSLKEELGKL